MDITYNLTTQFSKSCRREKFPRNIVDIDSTNYILPYALLMIAFVVSMQRSDSGNRKLSLFIFSAFNKRFSLSLSDVCCLSIS